MSDQNEKRRRGRPRREMPKPIEGVDARSIAHKVLNSPRRRPGEWAFLNGGKQEPVQALDPAQWASCAGCGSETSTLWHRARDEEGKIVYICGSCFQELDSGR